MRIRIILSVIAIFFVLLVLGLSLYIVDETEYAIVLRFGQIRQVISEPGLNFKTPFLDNVVKLNKRYLIYDIPPEKVLTNDKKTLIVDSYTIWKISDPKKFIETMRNVNLAFSRIDDVVYSGLRNTLGKLNFDTIVTQERTFLQDVTNFAKSNLKDFGIEILDVRVKRTDLPRENRLATFERMKSERQSIAALIRADGQRIAQEIRAEADKKATVILAEAKSKAEQIKGTGEASATQIYAETFSKSSKFYNTWKTLETYRTVIPGSIVLLDDEMQFLQQLRK